MPRRHSQFQQRSERNLFASRGSGQVVVMADACMTFRELGEVTLDQLREWPESEIRVTRRHSTCRITEPV
jgi:hypothetical protein